MLKALAELSFNVNWFFDDAETSMFTEPRDKAAHVDMVSEIACNDKEAIARRMQKITKVSSQLQKSREAVQSYCEEVKEAPIEAQIEVLTERLKAETFGRIAAEDRLNNEALLRMDSRQQNTTSVSFDDLGMAEGMGLLSRIYSSGDIVFIRAINANLMAFGEAIANKAMALETMKKMEEMEGRMMAMEQKIAGMEATPEKKEKAA